MAVLIAAWSLTGPAALAAGHDGAWSGPLAGFMATRLAQGGGSDPRMLAPGASPGSDWQAAKAARACASGGTVLRVDPNGQGYDVRVLVANQVVVVRIDGSGNCR